MNDADLERLAAEPIDAVDERALAELARLYAEIDPVPPGLVERLQFGVTLEALNAEVAQLQRFDSELAGVRSDDAGPTEAQTVTFTSDSITTMITITPAGPDTVRLDGWVAPGGGVVIELRTVDGRHSAAADANGRFVFDDVPRGLAQFLLRPPRPEQGQPVITPSIEL
jgi:hypothetical protein